MNENSFSSCMRGNDEVWIGMSMIGFHSTCKYIKYIYDMQAFMVVHVMVWLHIPHPCFKNNSDALGPRTYGSRSFDWLACTFHTLITCTRWTRDGPTTLWHQRAKLGDFHHSSLQFISFISFRMGKAQDSTKKVPLEFLWLPFLPWQALSSLWSCGMQALSTQNVTWTPTGLRLCIELESILQKFL